MKKTLSACVTLCLLMSACVMKTQLNLKPEVSQIPEKLELAAEEWAELIVAPVVIVQSSVDPDIWKNSGYDYDAWEEATRFAVSGAIQDSILSYVYPAENVFLVDPQDQPHLFAELKRSIAIGDASMLEVGKMLGASHLVIARVNRALIKRGKKETVQDTYNIKLLETETGVVLVSQTFFRD